MSLVFNGTTQALRAPAVDLSGVNAVSLSFWMWVDAWSPSADKLIFEFSSDYNGVSTGFIIDSFSATNLFVNLRGDIGNNEATYDVSAVSTGAWHHYVALFDKSQAVNEIDLYIDGTLQTPTSRPLTNNNGNNFASDVLNFMSRNSASLWMPGRLADVALWKSRLSGANISSLAAKASPPTISPAPAYYWECCGFAVKPGLASGYEWALAGEVKAARIGDPTSALNPSGLGCTGLANPRYQTFPKLALRGSLSAGRLL